MPCRTKAGQREYQRRWVRQRRARWLMDNGPWVQCGSFRDLQVDHIDPSQKVTHAVWSWSDERRATELAKCQVLCASCHRSKTAAQLSKPVTHGTKAAYAKGCRCRPCTDAASGYAMERRKIRLARLGSNQHCQIQSLESCQLDDGPKEGATNYKKSDIGR